MRSSSLVPLFPGQEKCVCGTCRHNHRNIYVCFAGQVGSAADSEGEAKRMREHLKRCGILGLWDMRRSHPAALLAWPCFLFSRI
jgi:hypothetical protein